MEKNYFLMYNDIVHQLNTCTTLEQLTTHFLLRLKLLIPFSYASIVLADPEQEGTFQDTPLCVPTSFRDAEEEYIRHMSEDHLLWLINGTESNLVRESDLMAEENRLNSPLYIHCYRKYNIYDTLQFSIVANQKLLGILTLFRTKIDGEFNEEDMFYLRSLGIHLNMVMNRLMSTTALSPDFYSPEFTSKLAERYHLTLREQQIIEELLRFKNNDEIADTLSICENTIQKHLQNIFRKMNVSSKWELLRRIRENI